MPNILSDFAGPIIAVATSVGGVLAARYFDRRNDTRKRELDLAGQFQIDLFAEIKNLKLDIATLKVEVKEWQAKYLQQHDLFVQLQTQYEILKLKLGIREDLNHAIQQSPEG